MSEKITSNTPKQYSSLKAGIGKLLKKGRQQAAKQINTVLVQTYWQIGKYIVEFEQKGEDRAQYGEQLLDTLSKDLSAEYGKGFSRSNLFQIRKFYTTFSIVQTPSRQSANSPTLSDESSTIQTLSELLSWSY